MRIGPHSLIVVAVTILGIAVPASASTLAPGPASARAPLAAPDLQTGNTGWIIWQSRSPIQRLALDLSPNWDGAGEDRT